MKNSSKNHFKLQVAERKLRILVVQFNQLPFPYDLSEMNSLLDQILICKTDISKIKGLLK
jgi:hypothetical protein